MAVQVHTMSGSNCTPAYLEAMLTVILEKAERQATDWQAQSSKKHRHLSVQLACVRGIVCQCCVADRTMNG